MRRELAADDVVDGEGSERDATARIGRGPPSRGSVNATERASKLIKCGSVGNGQEERRERRRESETRTRKVGRPRDARRATAFRRRSVGQRVARAGEPSSRRARAAVAAAAPPGSRDVTAPFLRRRRKPYRSS